MQDTFPTRVFIAMKGPYEASGKMKPVAFLDAAPPFHKEGWNQNQRKAYVQEEKLTLLLDQIRQCRKALDASMEGKGIHEIQYILKKAFGET